MNPNRWINDSQSMLSTDNWQKIKAIHGTMIPNRCCQSTTHQRINAIGGTMITNRFLHIDTIIILRLARRGFHEYSFSDFIGRLSNFSDFRGRLSKAYGVVWTWSWTRFRFRFLPVLLPSRGVKKGLLYGTGIFGPLLFFRLNRSVW